MTTNYLRQNERRLFLAKQALQLEPEYFPSDLVSWLLTIDPDISDRTGSRFLTALYCKPFSEADFIMLKNAYIDLMKGPGES